MKTATPLPEEVDSILRAVTRRTGVTREQLLTPGRGVNLISGARVLAMAVIRQTTDHPLWQCSSFLGKTDTTGATTSSALQSVARRIVHDQEFAETYAALLEGRSVLRPLTGGKAAFSPVQSVLRRAAIHERMNTRGNSKPGRKPSQESGHYHPSTHGTLEELGPQSLRRKLAEAEEQLTYWRGAKARALTDRDRLAAGARVSLWEMQIPKIRARINQLQLATA